MDTVDWLLDSDPALRWQVERDLLDAPADQWQATRARTATEGWGARLLALQDDDGQWAGGAYFPGRPDTGEGSDEHQPWTATTWSLHALREWGVDGEVLGDTGERLAANATWEYDDLPFWQGEVDCCINAFTLANGAWLGVDTSHLLDWFAEHQLDDGGWNCDWVEGATVASFHSTLNSLEGLLAYEELTGTPTRDLRAGGEAYLLERDLFRRRSTGEPVAAWATTFTSPPRWRYSVLRAADHLRRAAQVDGAVEPDPRVADAIDEIRRQRQPDGRWLQGPTHPGRVWFAIDVPEGEPSRWLTLTATRVLAWWDATT